MSGITDFTENLAAIYNPVVEIGTTWTRVLTLRDSTGTLINLTGMTAQADVRGATLIITLSTSNGRIVLGGALGTVTMTISATDTSALRTGQYDYDLLITSGSTVVKVVDGLFQVVGTVTI